MKQTKNIKLLISITLFRRTDSELFITNMFTTNQLPPLRRNNDTAQASCFPICECVSCVIYTRRSLAIFKLVEFHVGNKNNKEKLALFSFFPSLDDAAISHGGKPEKKFSFRQRIKRIMPSNM